MPSTNLVATVLTVYGIETIQRVLNDFVLLSVATVLTVYGIETLTSRQGRIYSCTALQQYLPFTVLKRGVTSCIDR